MKKKNNSDVLEMMSTFKTKVLEHKPSSKQMYDEVRMMRFKIRPVQGDISMLNLQNTHFIEVLWSLGKLDEFFQKNIDSLPADQRTMFFRLFDEVYKKFQQELNKISLKQESAVDNPNVFEMEIFKEKPMRIN